MRFIKNICFLFIFLISAVLLTAWPLKTLSARPVLQKLQSGDPLPADLFIKLGQIINPSVVNIFTSQFVQPASSPYLNDPFFDLFLYPSSRDSKRSRPVQSLGTGFLIDSTGLILTNTHVVRQAHIIKVQLMNSSRHYTAKLIGQDRYTDTALLKISAKKALPAADLGQSGDLKAGEWVAAFGNPYGQGHTMTKGIISAVNREIDELNLFPFLQTDASINPGNSGGPLVNTAGEVIGINTAMISHGIGFAIPIDSIKMILSDLKQHGRVRRGLIGVKMTSRLDPKKKGALIVEVLPGLPAKKAGIQPGDIITQFNNKKIKTYTDLFKAVASTPVNKAVSVKVNRHGKTLTLPITVRENTPLARTASAAKTPPPPPQSAAHLGMELSAGTKQIMSRLSLPPLGRVHPVITKITHKGWADKAGFQKKDIILKINGRVAGAGKDVLKLIVPNRTNQFHILRYRPRSNQYITLIIRIRAPQ